jgi:uncharacterized membrane protein YgcG
MDIMRLTSKERTQWILVSILVVVIAMAIWAYTVVRLNEAHFIELDGHVNDTAQIVDLDFLDRVRRICAGIQAKTQIDIVLATITSAKPFSTDIYAERLVRQWMDNHNQSRGVILILVSKQEGRINIEISRSIEFILPQAIGNRILEDHVVPMIENANKEVRNQLAGLESQPMKKIIGKGIHDGVVAIAARISDLSKLEIFWQQLKAADQGRWSLTPEKREHWMIVLYVILVIILVFIIFASYKYLVIRCTECRFRVKPNYEVIDVPEQNKPGLTIISYSCIKCGYTEKKRQVTWYNRYLFEEYFGVFRSLFKSRRRRKRREKRKKNYSKK